MYLARQHSRRRAQQTSLEPAPSLCHALLLDLAGDLPAPLAYGESRGLACACREFYILPKGYLGEMPYLFTPDWLSRQQTMSPRIMQLTGTTTSKKT